MKYSATLLCLLIIFITNGCAKREHSYNIGVWEKGITRITYGPDWEYIKDENGLSHFKHKSAYVAAIVFSETAPSTLDKVVEEAVAEGKRSMERFEYRKTYPLIQGREVCRLEASFRPHPYYWGYIDAYYYGGPDGIAGIITLTTSEAPKELAGVPREFIDRLEFVK